MDMRKKDLTEEEAAILDEYYTENLPKLGSNEGGVFDRRVGHLVSIDDIAANYIKAIVENTGKTPSRIINELVMEKLAASA